MQTHISKYLLLFSLFTYTLFGCTLCTVYSPVTKFYVDVETKENRIKQAEITWVLTKEFTTSLKDVYDRDANDILDASELKDVASALYDYVIPNNYLTRISYGETINKEVSLPIKVKEKKVYIKNSILHFNYKISLDLRIKKENALYVQVNDDQNFFILVLQKKLSKINLEEVSLIEGENDLVFNFSKDYIKEIAEPKQQIIKPSNDEIKLEDTSKKEETTLAKFVKKVKEYLVKIEQGDDFALFILLGVSFIYGIIHALGPGHGKTLAFSYFMANKSSYIKAFWVSQASAFIHIIGAFILVVISVFILQSILNNFVNDSVVILTKVSAIMIILLAIYILYNKLNHKSCSCSSCCSSSEEKAPTWSTSAPSAFNVTKTTNSLKANFMKQDLYFVLTAGLIPCPGTVVLFIYAFVLKTYFAVILAAIAISFGMGLVIFLSSFLGVSLKKFSQSSHKITNFFEILAPLVMLALGILLFLNANVF